MKSTIKMTATETLSSGVISRIMAGEEVKQPVLQILGVHQIANGDRLRLEISDGLYFNSFAMLDTQMNYLHADGKLGEFTIIQVNEYISTKPVQANNRRVLIILNISVLTPGSEVGHKIGDPVSLWKS